MVVISRTKKLSYRLGELDGSIAAKGYAGYRLIPYYPRDPTNLTITQVFDTNDLSRLAQEDSNIVDDPEDPEYVPLRRSARLAGQVGRVGPEEEGD